jgi:hypothetical protein
MTRHFAALTLSALLLTACLDDPSGPFTYGPPPVGETDLASPIGVSRATVLPGEEVMLWNAGCFDAEGYTRAWTFSDGGSAEGPSVSYRFADAGTYQVTLVASRGSEQHTHATTLQVVTTSNPDSLQPEIRW